MGVLGIVRNYRKKDLENVETGKDFLMSLQEIKEIYHRANFVEAPGGYLVGVYYRQLPLPKGSGLSALAGNIVG